MHQSLQLSGLRQRTRPLLRRTHKSKRFEVLHYQGPMTIKKEKSLLLQYRSRLVMVTRGSPQEKGLQGLGCWSFQTYKMRPPYSTGPGTSCLTRRRLSRVFLSLEEGRVQTFGVQERTRKSCSGDSTSLPTTKNLQLNNHRVGRIFDKTVLHRLMDHDMSQNLHHAAMGVKNTMGHIGVHLSQVCSLHL